MVRKLPLEERMQPKMRSQLGFLGTDEQLQDVIAADAAVLQSLDITCQQIADALEQRMKWAIATEESKGWSDTTYRAWMGSQECPWDDNSTTNKDYSIVNSVTKRGIHFSGLLPHLIAKHGFFEGKGTPYRLNPLEAILILGMPSPTKAKEQVEEMLYQQLVADIGSQYAPAAEHALRTLDWFKDMPDFPQAVLKAISAVRENKTWDKVYMLVYLAKQAPTRAQQQIDEELFSLTNLIDRETTADGEFALKCLRKFKRDVAGATEPNIVRGQYWSDLLEDAKKEQPSEAVAVCANYVNSRRLLLAEVCGRGTPLWNEFVLELKRYERGKVPDEKIVASFVKLEDTAKDDLTLVHAMKDKLPYLKRPPADGQGLEKRLAFYEVFCDLSALHVATTLLADNLAERAETLVRLGREREANDFASQAVIIYQAHAKHEPQIADIYETKIARLKTLI